MKLTPEIYQAIVDTRAILADEANWTKRYYARDIHGLPVQATDSSATCWCFEGALFKAMRNYEPNIRVWVRTVLYHYLSKQEGHNSLIQFNDAEARTHAEILAFLDSVIGNIKPMIGTT